MTTPQFVATGDVITAESGFLTYALVQNDCVLILCLCSGHGTQATEDKTLVATVSGFVERTNKLISVRPLNARCVVSHGASN